MTIDPQDDIVQDFLVESREILEALGEQLVELERRPEDGDLLNAVFRGFHTIKGGAGFLGFDELVDICHTTEDIFNLLRQGERTVTAGLMDDVLQALDVVNGMFSRLEAGEDLEPAPPALMSALRAHESGQDPGSGAGEPGAAADRGDGDVSARELGAVPGGPESGDAPASRQPEAGAAGDDITDDEFERLLDELHGEGRHGGTSAAGAGAGASTGPDSDDIGDDEFERLLDELHGPGRAPDRHPEPPGDAEGADGEPRAAPAPASESAPKDAGDAQSRGRAEATVRVDTAKLDDIMNLVGELVLVRNRLTNLRDELGDDRLAHTVGNLELVTSDLQSAVMKTRMQPIRKAFGRFPRVVRDLARSLDKEIHLTMHGEDTDLDKNLVEALADPLVHLVRNAVDHGLEGPDERRRAGKPGTGHVTLSAEQEGDHILLCIADDGRGMDPEALRGKAVEKGLIDPESARRLDDGECFNLIFAAGFSTREQISDVSGRGVGMDVVKNRISQLNGTVDIESRPGEGTTIRIKVPLTLAILPTLMVRVRGRKFALPMSVVQEIFELSRAQTNRVDNRRTVKVRGKAMPLFFLERWLERVGDAVPGTVLAEGGADVEDGRQVVTVQLGHQIIGLVVEEVIGLEEVVIKPLGALLHGLPGLAGSTITGDGRIALIVDIPSLIREFGRRL